MSESTPYIPYEATAKVIARHDDTLEEFLTSLFPNTNDSQMEKMVHYIAGKIHDGIELGLASGDYDPISRLEAYKLGYEDGKREGEI